MNVKLNHQIKVYEKTCQIVPCSLQDLWLWVCGSVSCVHLSQNMFFHNPIDKPKPLSRPLKSNHNIKISTGIVMFLNKDLHDLFFADMPGSCICNTKSLAWCVHRCFYDQQKA
uniref:Uncharacterized protein n=1 Tax=Brassica oleracea TaxID=3712 RepID=A0A3P6AJL0_BRAOL|nr:unnamed protein product [Brassica oleracea]